MNFIDRFLNTITMYRLMIYGLFSLIGIGFILSFFDVFSFTPLQLVATFFVITVVGEVSNRLLGKMFGAHLNVESASITSLILVLVVSPGAHLSEYAVIAAVTIVAMASKYVLAVNRKHLFNPVAIALVVAGLFGSGIGSWWVGSEIMLIPVLVFGLLVVRKIRRFKLLLPFLFVALVAVIATGVSQGETVSSMLMLAFTSYPIIFFGTVMLTEPQTMPPTARLQMIYGVIVGLLLGVQFHSGPLFSTPELALVVGNIFSFVVSPKYKLLLTLKDTQQLGTDMYELNFATSHNIQFKPGQYLEWTLTHPKPDTRGNRRYFTIASSPTETELKLGVRKATDMQSSFKQSLLDLKPGESIIATGLAGDFVVPTDTSKQLVFIAGGIGITPFRSMIKYFIDTNCKVNITLFYLAVEPGHFVYKDIFETAKKIGVKTHYILTSKTNIPENWSGHTGALTPELLKKAVPDLQSPTYYISGPNGMVTNYKKLLLALGIKRRDIKTDYFPGF